MPIKYIDAKEEKSFAKIIKLYKAFYSEDEQIFSASNLHKSVKKENSVFKSFYDNNKFIGFIKGFLKDDFFYISLFAFKSKPNQILDKIKEDFTNYCIILTLKKDSEIPFYLKNGFSLINNKELGLGIIVTSNSSKFDAIKLASGIKENEWPLIFDSRHYSYIYYADVSALNIDNIISQLPNHRLEKVNRLKFLKDKKLSAGAYLLLKKALKRHHINIDEYKWEVEEKGKPRLINCPYQFSLSHSGNYVLLGLCKDPIGVDIEEITEIKENLINYVFNELDLSYYQSKEDKVEAFYKIWTFKESYLKCLGVGLSQPLKEVKINYLYSYNGHFFYEFNNLDNYQISVCSTNYQFKINKVIL